MRWFRRTPKCPNCDKSLEKKPTRKQECPHCGHLIIVRSGELVTEEEAQTADWLQRFSYFGVSRKDFDNSRSKLSNQFGKTADINDTVWNILNELLIKNASDPRNLEIIYREMASLVSSEDKDPTPYLLEAERARSKWTGKPQPKEKEIFLSHDELAYAKKLRNDGKLDEAKNLLTNAIPSPAVLDELRKVASVRAKRAKKEGDWQAVINYLNEYNLYAEEYRDSCIELANQEPPTHTKSDLKLLQQAQIKIAE